MIKKRLLLHFLVIFFVVTSGLFLFSLNFLQPNQDNSDNYGYITVPKSSGYILGGPLSPNDINISKTDIYQYFETINIQLNVSDYLNDEHHTYVQLSDLNGNTEEYNMTRVNGDLFSFNYSTSLNPQSQLLDFINVSFFVYNESNALLNAHSTSKNFTINPNCRVIFVNDSIYHVGELLFADLMPDLNSVSLYGWDSWNVSIDEDLDKVNGNLFNISGYNPNTISFLINESFSQVNKNYYVRVNLINSSINQVLNSSCYRFFVENENPKIIISTITLNSTSIFRSDEDNCLIQLNASDLETTDPTFINVSLEIQYSLSITYKYGLLDNNQDGSFQLAFHAPYSLTPGDWKINITAIDSDSGLFEYTHGTALTIKNNAPEIHDYKINGISLTQGITIYYGDSMIFSFNVSDVDGEITNITVILISYNNRRIERSAGSDLTITFSSYELVIGIWFVYVYIEDSDGAMTSLTDDYLLAPQAITIITDLLGAVLPWIALVIGLIIGLLVGVGVGYYRIKTKILEGQEIKTKKKSTTQKKTITEKKSAKLPSKPSSADAEKNDVEEKDVKAEPDNKTPQRKIKRKL